MTGRDDQLAPPRLDRVEMERVVGRHAARARVRVSNDVRPPAAGFRERYVAARVPAPEHPAVRIELLDLAKYDGSRPRPAIWAQIDSPPRGVGVDEDVPVEQRPVFVPVGDRALCTDDPLKVARQRVDLVGHAGIGAVMVAE